jgi:hypothetical protein
MTMNAWTPIAALAVAGLALSIGCQVNAVAPSGGACSNQPNMSAALSELRQAREWLGKAEHNKGGWRDAAIESADRAIHETERGCAFADNH